MLEDLFRDTARIGLAAHTSQWQLRASRPLPPFDEEALDAAYDAFRRVLWEWGPRLDAADRDEAEREALRTAIAFYTERVW